MHSQPECYYDFLNKLKDKTVAIVYSFSTRTHARDIWYDRWRSDVVMFHGQGVEELGAEPRYVDVDLYLHMLSNNPKKIADYVINLHSGLLDIANWPIISTNASWNSIAVSPCSTDVLIVTERKDIANIIAATTRIKVPEAWSPHPTDETPYIVKPVDLGMSRGVTKKPRAEIHKDDYPRAVIQEFIPGLDATVSVIRLPSGQYYLIDAEIEKAVGHEGADFVDEQAKIRERLSGTHADIPIKVNGAFASEIFDLCNTIGPASIYRVDFRVVLDEGGPPAEMNIDNSFFLEINSMPTVSPKSSYGQMALRWLTDHERLSKDFDPRFANVISALGPEAAYTSILLFNSDQQSASTIEYVRSWQ